jgi:hypothetical protein
LRPEQLAGNQQARGRPNQAPNRCGNREGPDDVIVVLERFDSNSGNAGSPLAVLRLIVN